MVLGRGGGWEGGRGGEEGGGGGGDGAKRLSQLQCLRVMQNLTVTETGIISQKFKSSLG